MGVSGKGREAIAMGVSGKGREAIAINRYATKNIFNIG
jgi:hypothetical protein